MRLIDADIITHADICAALGARYASCADDVQNLINEAPTADAVPMDYHERCMELAEAEKIKLAKALKLAQKTNRRILENYSLVVRCKDCVYRYQDTSCMEGFREDEGWCMMQWRATLPDDFCSEGERRENEHDKG